MSFIATYAAMLLILNGVSGTHIQESGSSKLQLKPCAASQQNEDAVLRRIRSVLRAGGYAGLIACSGCCDIQRAESAELPRIDVPQPSGAATLDAIRKIFQNNAAVKVTEEPGKVIRITIGSPSTAILQTRISSLHLGPKVQYNPGLATFAILGADEVKAELRKLNFHTPQVINFGMLLAEPAPGLPHLPATLKNVTVGQVLNLIARKFDGIVIYRTCVQPSGTGLVKINFVGLGELGSESN